MKEIENKKGFRFVKNHDEGIKRDVKDYFEDPELFLRKNNKIFIGKSYLKKKESNINNLMNNTLKKNSNNNTKSLKGININTDIGFNLSTIPNETLKNKNKEEIFFKNNSKINALNTINISKELNYNQTNNSKVFKNINENNINFNTNENNKQNYFNKRTIAYNIIDKDKNIYCVTEGNNKRKNKISKLSEKKNKKFILKNKNKENENKENSDNSEIKVLKNKKIISSPKANNIKRPQSVGIHYKFKTSKEIVDTYKEGKNRENKSKINGTDFFIPKEVEEKTKKNYMSQEKKLKENLIRNYMDKNISNYLSKRCHKKEENLLYNNIEDFRIKRQLLDYLENQKNLFEKLGNHFWYVDLRRPSFLKEPRGLFLNIGKEENQIWEPLVEFPMKNVEIIKKAETPHKEKCNFEKFLIEKNLYPDDLFNPNKKYLNKKRIKKRDRNKMPDLNEMNDMVIRGKNMISFEKENFLNFDEKLNLSGHKYRVFKDPREDNARYSKDCIYKFNYQYEGLPYKTNKGIKRKKRNKTPVNVENEVKTIKAYYSDEKGNKIVN